MPWLVEKMESPAETAVLAVREAIEAGSRPYLDKLWEDEMHAVCLAAETDFGEVYARVNHSGIIYRFLLATTAEQRRVGLSFRTMLPEGFDGMLFAYTSEDIRTFGAEFTKMDLDLYGFDSRGVLTGEKYLPAGSINTVVVSKVQYLIETTKDIEFEFLELVQ